MLEAERGPSPADESWAGYLLVAGRHVLGYLLAVSAGSVIFAVIANVLPSVVYRPDPDPSGLIASIREAALMYSMLGTVFGIPYTVLGTVAFRLWLPRTRPVFLLVGMLCPAVAALLTMLTVGGIRWVDWDFLLFLALTLPAGLAAAYIFGAIGLGYGFGRWRPG